MVNIPFCKSGIGAEEKAARNAVVDSGWGVMGKVTQELEGKFAEYVGSKYAVMVDSGTSALFLSAQLLLHKKIWFKKAKIKVPSLTFTSTAEIIHHSGMIPVFSDVSKEDFCLEEVDSIFS